MSLSLLSAEGQDGGNFDRLPFLPEHPFDYSYTVTCHKAQGDDWGRVLVYQQHCDLWDPKRWNYTATSPVWVDKNAPAWVRAHPVVSKVRRKARSH